MTTKRTPLARGLKAQITPAAIAAYRRMRAWDGRCTCPENAPYPGQVFVSCGPRVSGAPAPLLQRTRHLRSRARGVPRLPPNHSRSRNPAKGAASHLATLAERPRKFPRGRGCIGGGYEGEAHRQARENRCWSLLGQAAPLACRSYGGASAAGDVSNVFSRSGCSVNRHLRLHYCDENPLCPLPRAT